MDEYKIISDITEDTNEILQKSLETEYMLKMIITGRMKIRYFNKRDMFPDDSDKTKPLIPDE